MFVEKTQKTLLNNTHHHVLCASVCFITCLITDKNPLSFGIYSHKFFGKVSEKEFVSLRCAQIFSLQGFSLLIL